MTVRESSIIDLHTHILPQMDDGSDGVETSLAMLERLAAQGVTMVCATSHYYAEKESIDVFAWRRNQALNRLREGLALLMAEKGMPVPDILPGAEVAFFSGICESSQLDQLCLQGTSTLLVEMPFTEWNRFQIEEILSLVLDRDYQVVLVHPERFCFSKINVRYLKKLAELPIAFQVNADTLTRWRTRRQGMELLKLTDWPLLGTDCHNLTSRSPHMDLARSAVKKQLGSEFLRKIDENARRLTAVKESMAGGI